MLSIGLAALSYDGLADPALLGTTAVLDLGFIIFFYTSGVELSGLSIIELFTASLSPCT